MLVGGSGLTTFSNGASPTARKIEEFRALPPGWSLGEGQAFSSKTIVAAKRLLAHLESYGYTETDAFPGLDGEILVKGYGKKDRIELIAESDETFTFAVPGESEFLVYVEGLSEDECVKRISKMVSRPGLTSESSTLNIIWTDGTGDSLASLLEERTESFLSSVSSARLQQADLCAST